MSIKEHCVKIYELLKEAGESGWSNGFRGLIAELEANENISVYRKIISIYGGAGSFNDLVLYKNGAVCSEENNELDRLRNGLYNKIAEKWT
ncbi:hypothetical protein HYN59_06050 [Flavobacterium album]|uniref:DUF6966 domain-containing protein n=1 Tax=Flavobacterium album TaxID=2175091 RepID=A0A2S1QWB8_9FLAO|nr:hypothetical protein [Flavobacterium album]AWH84708.1 hypothetical protein HYN59_06050 [Flavobacterium album]